MDDPSRTNPDSFMPYKALFDQSPIAIELYDHLGNLLQVNAACLNLFGVDSMNEILGFSLFSDPNLGEEHKRKLRDGQSVRYSDRFDFNKVRELNLYRTTREGILWLDVQLSPLTGEDDRVSGYLVQIQDVTKEKQAESALNEALVRAEASDRLKTAFMNNISHEVRTPLNGILGFAQILDDPDLTGADRALYLEILQNSSDRLLETINSYMDISLLVSGNMMVTKFPFNLTKMLEEGCECYRDAASAKGIRIVEGFSGDRREILLDSDQELVRKVVSHLIGNAVKFTESGTITVTGQSSGSTVTVTVSDSGIGIPKELCDRIFDSFLQADLSTTRRHEGSGLGLAIAKGIVELLGGRIWVESEPGTGSTFGLELPGVVDIQPEEPVEVHTPCESDGTQPVILIVEDEQVNVLLLESILSRLDSNVHHVENGALAIDFCREHPETDLVLMDLKMPVMDGFEATRILRSFRPDLPVVAVTAFAISGDRERALHAGCDDYLSKPFSQAQVIELVGKYIPLKFKP